MKRSLQSLLILSLIGACLTLPAQADGTKVPITGTHDDGGFAGTFTLERFERNQRQVQAVGTLSGTLTDRVGKEVYTLNKMQVALPLSFTRKVADAETFTLPLGPINLEIAGVTIDLAPTQLSLRYNGEALEKLFNHLTLLLNDFGGETAGLLDGAINALVTMLNRFFEPPRDRRLRTT